MVRSSDLVAVVFTISVLAGMLGAMFAAARAVARWARARERRPWLWIVLAYAAINRLADGGGVGGLYAPPLRFRHAPPPSAARPPAASKIQAAGIGTCSTVTSYVPTCVPGLAKANSGPEALRLVMSAVNDPSVMSGGSLGGPSEAMGSGEYAKVGRAGSPGDAPPPRT